MVSTIVLAQAESRQGSRGPLACYGWCRAHLDFSAGRSWRSDGENHDERADWPLSQSRGRAAAAFVADAVICGWMRLRLPAASRERCRLQWRPAIGVVRASARIGFSGGFLDV